jgi:hypothetical protein
MNDITKLDWAALPYIDVPDLNSVDNIPKNIECCIYFVCSKAKGLLYIGLTTVSLFSRFRRYMPSLELSHKCIPLIMFLKDCRIHYSCIDIDIIHDCEKALIWHHSPFFNEQHAKELCTNTYEDFSEYLEFRSMLHNYDCTNIYELEYVIHGCLEYWPKYLDHKIDRMQRWING